ncbi:MAG: adenylate/guanylate cyclase domain-containing protein, partial [Proteobacteria bacterium]|nr:adenylate/guanylate cyclase domain-containing protein [Pseudomonadota bacterium]
MAEERVQRRLAAILAADVVGYSRLMEKDEAGTLARLQSLRAEIIDPKISEHSGRIVKTMGDGLLVEFGSAVNAVENALAIQSAIADHNVDLPENQRLVFRVGINLGDVLIEGDDIHGDGVNVAARLEGLCGPGEVFLSGSVFDQVSGKIVATFDNLGEQTVKNIARPISVYRAGSGQRTSVKSTDLSETLRPPDKPSIAVLPFASYSHDEEQGYLADGIAEDIITQLSKISGLFVIGGNSSATYKDRTIGAREVGRELGVKYVLEGSVRRSGERIRISAKLVDTADNHNLWIDRYDRTLTDIFDLQEEVANEVANALELRLSPAEMGRLSQKQGGSLEVYNLHQQARAAVNPPLKANTLAARSILQRAIEIDPSYAPGFAGLSISHARAVFYGHSDDPDRDLSEAFKFATKALSLDSTLGICHSAYARACYAPRQFDQAIHHSQHAVEIQPGDADSYGYLGVHLAHGSRALESIDAIKRALEIEPMFIRGPYLNQLGFSYWAAYLYEEAIEALQKNIDRGGPSHSILGQSYWTACLVELGRLDEAKQKATGLRDGFPDFSPSPDYSRWSDGLSKA